MCFVNQSICSGCAAITETPTPKKPCASTPDVIQHGCSGQKVVVEVEHTGPESCLSCYYNELLKIQRKWETEEKISMDRAKAQGSVATQAMLLIKGAKREMLEDITRLDEEWEKMWCA